MITRGIIALLICAILAGASPSPVQGLTLLARDMGFEGEVAIVELPKHGAQYFDGLISVDPWILIGFNPKTIHAILAHEFEHAIFGFAQEKAFLDNDPVAWFHVLSIVFLPKTGITPYAERAGNNSEAIAEVARLVDLGQTEQLSNAWLRAYYALDHWYLENH